MEPVDSLYLTHLLEHFSLKQKAYQFRPIHTGYINDTYLVLDIERPKYILQRINHAVFKDIAGLMGNIAHALRLLKDKGYEQVSLVETISGGTFHEEDGYWRLMSYIDQSTTFNTTTEPNIAFEAGRIIGRFHHLMAKSNLDDFADTIPNFHHLGLRFTRFNEVLASASKDRMTVAATAIAFAEKMFGQLQPLILEKLPIRICHNDTKLNNILFSKSTQKALCLIDLDTLMKGCFYFDFGDAIRTIVNPANEDERDLNKITFDKKLFTSFVQGLGSEASFLTNKEMEHLPMGAVFMPFIHGLRALTDFLEYNKYYKVSYENQNLDRCLSLFHFTQIAWDEIPFMQSEVHSELVAAL